jgi:hypothetical protein
MNHPMSIADIVIALLIYEFVMLTGRVLARKYVDWYSRRQLRRRSRELMERITPASIPAPHSQGPGEDRYRV